MIWETIIPVVGKVLERVLPDKDAANEAKLKLLELAQKGELAQLEADIQLATGQLEINKIEAGSSDAWRGGWRPAVGWTCCAGLFYTFLLRPLLPWVATVIGFVVPELPELDMGPLLTLLGGILGLGGMRSYERTKGVIPKGK
jgi:hypothetical protein